jgi:hypothetical protein
MADLSTLLKTWPVRLAKDVFSSAYSAATLPGDVWAGRVSLNDPEYYERATDLAGFTTMGTLAGPRGVLGSGATRRRPPPPPPPRHLPMDLESRMQRARDMGFLTDHPVYHGTAAAPFDAFDLGKAGSVTRAAPARQGIWTSEEPAVANAFAKLAADKTGGNPHIMPLFARTDNPLILKLKGNPTLDQLGERVAQAWRDGHDAVVVHNHFLRGGSRQRGDSLVLRNPNQLRSTQAAFDPARRNESDLLAGIGGAAAAGLPQWFNGSDDEGL